MNLSKLNIGILHSLIGKNDGVSIVIDQSIEAMVRYMDVSQDNIYFLSALAPARLNKMEDEIFWHKNEANKYILKHYRTDPPEGFEGFIEDHVAQAEHLIAKFIDDYHIDLMIVHNASHPTNFVYAVAVGRYFEKLRQKRQYLPRYLLWWHDSHFERERFLHPNPVIKSFLNYIPGPYAHGIVFINTMQAALARRVYLHHFSNAQETRRFFNQHTAVIPNTCDIPWSWKRQPSTGDALLVPPMDNFNKNFFEDIGLLAELEELGASLDETLLILQHTRIVARKRIDYAIDFAFLMHERLSKKGHKKATALIISGHSGDEDDAYISQLRLHFDAKLKQAGDPEGVMLLFAEHRIFAEREVIIDKRYYRFRDIPGIIALHGGIGSYFSEAEGYGNNLLEMISMGLPVLINRYPVYKKDIERLGFMLPAIEDGQFTEAFLEAAEALVIDPQKRAEAVRHNLSILDKKLSHKVISKKMEKVLQNMFRFL
jgi:glycosyltransferase involved in cell wall biosynthesis